MTTWLPTLAAFGAGGFAWSFLEYAIHNWRGHLGKGKNAFSREHLKHHRETHYFAPAWKKGLAAAIVIPLTSALASIALAPLGGLAFGFGLGLTYLAYELAHWRFHVAAPRNRYWAYMRKHHFFHHFQRPAHNHGVTSPLWDVVFGTFTAVDRVDVPRKHAMLWLVDAHGAVKAEYRADYRLVGRAAMQAATVDPLLRLEEEAAAIG